MMGDLPGPRTGHAERVSGRCFVTGQALSFLRSYAAPCQYEGVKAELAHRVERREGDVVIVTGNHEDHGRVTLCRENADGMFPTNKKVARTCTGYSIGVSLSLCGSCNSLLALRSNPAVHAVAETCERQEGTAEHR